MYIYMYISIIYLHVYPHAPYNFMCLTSTCTLQVTSTYTSTSTCTCISEMSMNWVFSTIRCGRIGYLFAIQFHWNICINSSTATNWDVYKSGQMLCRFVDIDEFGCLRIGTNVVPIRSWRRIKMSTRLAIGESICYRVVTTLHRGVLSEWEMASAHARGDVWSMRPAQPDIDDRGSRARRFIDVRLTCNQSD